MYKIIRTDGKAPIITDQYEVGLTYLRYGAGLIHSIPNNVVDRVLSEGQVEVLTPGTEMQKLWDSNPPSEVFYPWKIILTDGSEIFTTKYSVNDEYVHHDNGFLHVSLVKDIETTIKGVAGQSLSNGLPLNIARHRFAETRKNNLQVIIFILILVVVFSIGLLKYTL